MRGPWLLTSVSCLALACTGLIAPGGDITGASGEPEMGVAGAGGAGNGGLAGAGSAGNGGLAGSSASLAGTGAVTGAAGSAAPATGAAGAGPCVGGGIPADVAGVINATCIACHGTPPLPSVPSSLSTYADLVAPSKTDPTKSVVAVALARMQSTTMPMPPAPVPSATAAQISVIQAWVAAGTPPGACPDGGAPGVDAGGVVDPYGTPVVCTSNTTWTQGRHGSSSMEPGMACIACHSLGEGPKFALGGTIYPTAHEPDLCDGGNVTTSARIVVTGADGSVLTLKPNAAGNFDYEGALATPYSVEVTYMGRVRVMLEKQTSGDCNACHTQAGATMAPGRIMLP